MPVRQRAAPRRRKRPDEWQPTPLPAERGLLIPTMAQGFAELGVGASLWLYEQYWLPIHVDLGVALFERELNAMPRRWAYNERAFARTIQSGRTYVGEHAGFKDLFVPVVEAGEMRAVLVVGPFATSRPTIAEVQQRWRDLGGGGGKASDPMFARYLATTNSVLTVEGDLFDALLALAQRFAALLGDEGKPERLGQEVAAARHRLQWARFPERVWEAARGLLEERAGRPPALLDHGEMAAFGLREMPQHVLVGLATARRPGVDSLSFALRCAAFQRAAALFGRDHRAICGRLGDHGIVLLLEHAGSASRGRAALNELASRAGALARRFDLLLHSGVSQALGTAPLAALYRAAHRAAEKALAEGQSVVHGEPRAEASTAELARLRTELERSVGTSPDLLSLRFNRYAEAVLVHSGYRLERVRVELEVGLAGLTGPLLETGILDPKSFDVARAALWQRAEGSLTISELVASYREVVADLERALRNPTRARHDRGMQRALAFIREHSSEAVTVAEAARVAGFAADYFSRLFKREQGTTFRSYLKALRLERAKQMLEETTLSVEQIQKLAGFRTRTHFHAAFRGAVGTTPIEFRERGE